MKRFLQIVLLVSIWGLPCSGQVNIAMEAAVSASFVSPWESLDALSNGSLPGGSDDRSTGIYGNWNTPNTLQWVQFEWSKKYKISSTEVFWFADQGGILLPVKAELEYWDGIDWIHAGEVGLKADQFNSLELHRIATNKLRLSVKNGEQSSGIIEWRVFGEANIPPVAWSEESYAFNGLSQFQTMPEKILSGSADFAISTWIKLNALEQDAVIFAFGSQSSGKMNLTADSESRRLKYKISLAGVLEEQIIEANDNHLLKTGEWQHILVKQQGNLGLLYLNGIEVGRNDKLSLNPSRLGKLSNCFIGKSLENDLFLDGNIREFKVFRTPPKEDQIPELIATKKASQPLPESSWFVINSEEDVKLEWENGGYITSSRLFFGETQEEFESSPAPMADHLEPNANSFTIPTKLKVGKTYYWRVDAVNGSEIRKGDVWKFRYISPKLRVFLLGGQSNMVGCSPLKDLPDSLKREHDNVLVFSRGEVSQHFSGKWSVLGPGMGTNLAFFGPELAFGPAISRYFPEENIAIIKTAWGGTNLKYQWRPPGSGGEVGPLYLEFVEAVREGLSKLPAQFEPELTGMLWMQGESDAFEPLSDEYEFNLANFIRDIREEFKVADLPFIIGQINNAPAWPDSAKVKSAQMRVSKNLPYTGIVYTDDYGLCDPWHYDAKGEYSLGLRFAQALREELIKKENEIVSKTDFLKPDTLRFDPFIWKSTPPEDCPFRQSKELNGLYFYGQKSGFQYGDTWYPSWAEDDKLYSPWTDGNTWKPDGSWEEISSGTEGNATTGHGIIEGDDPMTMRAYSIGSARASALPYHGRYPAGSLVYNKVWYYGTYCLDPSGWAKYGNSRINWPWLGPFVGFRYSEDYGKSWTDCPLTPEKPLFQETGINGYPVKIGSPHFVDFGQNMEHSPDGKAYLVAHGADIYDTDYRFWNSSWINGDQVYLLRVSPTIENMNDISKYEFFSGYNKEGEAIWTSDFKEIKPLLEWNNNMGCVTVSYNAPLKKYLMCITDGGNTCSKMNTYILESDQLTGEWKLVTYMKDFGEQAYFVNFPSKFISADGKTAWMLYSGNFAPNWNGMEIKENPPGSHYGLVMQKVEFLGKDAGKRKK